MQQCQNYKAGHNKPCFLHTCRLAVYNQHNPSRCKNQWKQQNAISEHALHQKIHHTADNPHLFTQDDMIL